MKFYAGDEVEVTYANDIYVGTITGFYENGSPRFLSNKGRIVQFPNWVWEDGERIAITKPGAEREQVKHYFNERSFWDRLCYLFTGKMP